MSLKQLLVSSYGKELYKETLSLQQQKIKKAIAKNQIIFLQRCIHHNITPKSFQIKSPIKSKKTFNIMKKYSRKLMVIARNGVKQRIHEATVKVKQICENLKRRINDERFALIDRTTEKSKEKKFTKKKNHLINKFEKLKNSIEKKGKQKATSYIKQAGINLTDVELTEEQMSLLNLAPTFVPTTKRIPFMDIISAAETWALDLENTSKEIDAEFLRQKVSHIRNKNLYIKLRDNLSKPQRKALVQMKNNKDTTIYPFDKGSGFVVLPEKKCYANN